MKRQKKIRRGQIDLPRKLDIDDSKILSTNFLNVINEGRLSEHKTKEEWMSLNGTMLAAQGEYQKLSRADRELREKSDKIFSIRTQIASKKMRLGNEIRSIVTEFSNGMSAFTRKLKDDEAELLTRINKGDILIQDLKGKELQIAERILRKISTGSNSTNN